MKYKATATVKQGNHTAVFSCDINDEKCTIRIEKLKFPPKLIFTPTPQAKLIISGKAATIAAGATFKQMIKKVTHFLKTIFGEQAAIEVIKDIQEVKKPTGKITDFKLMTEPRLKKILKTMSTEDILSTYAKVAGLQKNKNTASIKVNASTLNSNNFKHGFDRPVSNSQNVSKYAKGSGTRSFIALTDNETTSDIQNKFKKLLEATTSGIAQLKPDITIVNNGISEEKYYEVEVLYGTDRQKKNNTKKNSIEYTAERGAQLRVGTCKISIPKKRKPGRIPRPFSFLGISFPENPEKHVMVLEITEQTKEDFYSSLANITNTKEGKSGLLFIHGYNNDFNTAVRRTAQLKFDLSFKGPAFTFSWPSRNKTTPTGYTADEASVRTTEPYLMEFLQGIIASGIQQLNIIAHSMGNRAITGVLKELSLQDKFPSQIKQIICAAPDIDSTEFEKQIAPVLGAKTSLTLYASKKDKALMLSEAIRANYPRAGEAGKSIIVIKEIETIDASEVDTDLLGHGYIAESKVLLDDVFGIVRHGFRAKDRNLIEKKYITTALNYWQLP